MLSKQQRDAFQGIQNKVGWLDYRIEELSKITEDLPTLYNQVRKSDNYLHKVLPIHIQNQILDTCTATLAPKEKLSLFKFCDSKFDQLEKTLKETTERFDKVKYNIPVLREDIEDITDLVQELEEKDIEKWKGLKRKGGSSDSDSDSDEDDDDESGHESQEEDASAGEEDESLDSENESESHADTTPDPSSQNQASIEPPSEAADSLIKPV